MFITFKIWCVIDNVIYHKGQTVQLEVDPEHPEELEQFLKENARLFTIDPDDKINAVREILKQASQDYRDRKPATPTEPTVELSTDGTTKVNGEVVKETAVAPVVKETASMPKPGNKPKKPTPPKK